MGANVRAAEKPLKHSSDKLQYVSHITVEFDFV